MSKKLLSMVICIVMLTLLLTGCGGPVPPADSGSSGDSDDLNFAIIVKSYQSTYWLAAVKGATEQMNKKGVNATFNGPNSESDIADQVQMFNDAINSKPDGIGLLLVILLLCLTHSRQLKMQVFLLSPLTQVFLMHLLDLYFATASTTTIKQALQQQKVFGQLLRVELREQVVL